jgi:hypothetical protein
VKWPARQGKLPAGPAPVELSHVSTSTVPSPRAARRAPPPIRCGKCRWTTYIETDGRTGGKVYSVIPLGEQPGFRGVWRLRTHGTQTTYTVARPKRGPATCSCPDHETTGAFCKHMQALACIGLLKRPRRKSAPSRAKGLKAHAKNAKAAIVEARALPAEARQHLASLARADALGINLPEGWQIGGSPVIPAPAPAPAAAAKALPPAPEGSFTAGFRAAVENHLALRRGDLIECAACRYPFDPEAEGSAPLALCGPCLDEQKGGRS